MKIKSPLIMIALTLPALFIVNSQLSTAYAQGTAFTYQGRLNSGGSPAAGTYNLTFTLFSTNNTGVPIAGPVTNNTVAITNGLFTVLIDFGAGLFTGTNYWLEIGVESNGVSPFTTLAPRQQLTPTPYAIYAESVVASGISGTLLDAQLLHSAVTVNPGPGLSGGGRVGLGNTIILTNTGVLSVTGNADITAATAGGAVTLGDTGTNTDTPNLIVKRDGSGNFSTATITLDGNLNLPFTTATAGIIYSGGVTMIHAYGNQNFFAGLNAGNLTMSGGFNTATGQLPLNNNTSGYDNTANGYATLYLNTSGSGNTAVGAWTLFSNTNGSYNTAIGSGALEYNVNGFGNAADGYVALFQNSSGSANTAMGAGAIYSNTNGSYNTALGNNALFSNTSGMNNTASGYQALYSNTGDTFGDGSYNTADGYEALYLNTLGLYNTANGYQALYSNTSGSENTANGSQALFLNMSGNYNTANGGEALYSNTSGSDNTANGFQALFSSTTGNNNTANGYGALSANTNGSGNTANGYNALVNSTSGSDNVANGRAALFHNTSGSDNVANGVQALNSNSLGSENTANGFQALYSNTGDGVSGGAFNVADGAGALFHNALGTANTAVGDQALYDNTSGNDNIALGQSAGYNLTTGGNNIDIGNNGVTGDDNTIRIGIPGTQAKTFIAGISGATAASGVAVYVNSSGQLGTLTSSRRFKDDIQGMDKASDVIYTLKPVTFKYKPGIDPQGIPQFGLVAEDVEKVAPDLVAHDDQGKVYTVRYQAVDAMLLNEFLKEHSTVEDQSGEIQNLKHQNDSLEKRLNELEKAVARIAEKSGATFALNSKATANK